MKTLLVNGAVTRVWASYCRASPGCRTLVSVPYSVIRREVRSTSRLSVPGT
jgi:hypothetical protein